MEAVNTILSFDAFYSTEYRSEKRDVIQYYKPVNGIFATFSQGLETVQSLLRAYTGNFKGVFYI